MTTLHRDAGRNPVAPGWRDLTREDVRPWPDCRLRGRGLAGRREQPSGWAYLVAIALWAVGVYQVLSWLAELAAWLLLAAKGMGA